MVGNRWAGGLLITRDQLVYLGKVAEWLGSAPDGKLAYGEFYPSKVLISFDGDPCGQFVSDDPDWFYETQQEMDR